MKSIRYFGTSIDPSGYRRGHGVLGWWTCLLNDVRAWLEKRIVLNVLEMELRKAGKSKDERRHLRMMAEADPTMVPEEFHPVVRSARSSLLRDKVPLLRDVLEGREERYRSKRKNHVFENDVPVRPVRFEDGAINKTFAAYSQHRTDRSARYFNGRSFMVENVDGDFEAVPTERKP